MADVEILNECTLLQAAEWISLQWEPMDKIYEQSEGRRRPKPPWLPNIDFDTAQPSIEWDKYSDGIAKGTAKLTIALRKKQITATGKLVHTDNLPLGSTPIQSEREPIDFESFFDLDISNNRVTVANEPLYTDIRIDFDELSSLYQGPNRKHPNEYKSIYMKLMEEVVFQENITDKNQSKHAVLKDIIINKMHEKKLPASDKLADAMATLIRQPWSQKGRNKKG